MSLPQIGPLLLVVCLTLVSPAIAGTLTIDEWVLSTGIRNLGTSQDDWDHSTLVQNPFLASHFAHLGNSTATSTFDFAWWDANATFIIQSTQTAEGVPTSLLFTAASGYIYVTPTEALALTIDAQWTFNLPRYYMDTTLLVSVYGVNSHVSLFSETTGGQTSYPEPASGTVTITGNIVLPPTDTWVLRYDMNIKTFSGTQGTTATGNGYVDFHLSPEPATFFLLVLGSLLLRGRPH